VTQLTPAQKNCPWIGYVDPTTCLEMCCGRTSSRKRRLDRRQRDHETHAQAFIARARANILFQVARVSEIRDHQDKMQKAPFCGAFWAFRRSGVANGSLRRYLRVPYSARRSPLYFRQVAPIRDETRADRVKASYEDYGHRAGGLL
jgi:hypothetical protein